jgi:hypothetical protein
MTNCLKAKMKKTLLYCCVMLGACLWQHKLVAQATNKVDTVGNIGAGTTSPSSRLTIRQSSDPSMGSDGTGGLRVYNTAGSSFGQLQVNSSGVELSSSAGATDLPLFLNVSRSGIPPFTITTAKNIGIGTLTPGSTLDVAGIFTLSGSGDANKFITTTGNSHLTIQSTGAAGAIRFFTENGTSANEKMRVDASGNVGIGVTAPTEKLSVNGNVYANGNISAYGIVKTKKVVVTQTAWPDYVFTDDYKLATLSSLESYIRTNRHLPGVPSVKDVEENGISVGDNQALLLRKIEELTLYVIALEKKSNRQQTDLKNLKEQSQILKKNR